jgi:hypothetical protein
MNPILTLSAALAAECMPSRAHNAKIKLEALMFSVLVDISGSRNPSLAAAALIVTTRTYCHAMITAESFPCRCK